MLKGIVNQKHLFGQVKNALNAKLQAILTIITNNANVLKIES